MSEASVSTGPLCFTHHEEILKEYLRTATWKLPTEWPNAVGDCVERAQAIIEFGTPYYVIKKSYNKLKHSDSEGLFDCLRVVLYLDTKGYVAIKPKVG
jgi:hypothetical protein